MGDVLLVGARFPLLALLPYVKIRAYPRPSAVGINLCVLVLFCGNPFSCGSAAPYYYRSKFARLAQISCASAKRRVSRFNDSTIQQFNNLVAALPRWVLRGSNPRRLRLQTQM